VTDAVLTVRELRVRTRGDAPLALVDGVDIDAPTWERLMILAARLGVSDGMEPRGGGP
jgi:hypothetical protein